MVQYKFIKPFSATVTVGGAVGIMQKSFTVGQVVEGSPDGNGIKIRIAPHSVFNEGAPSNVSYQEFLTVPNEYLQLVSGSLSSIPTPVKVIGALAGIALVIVAIRFWK